MSLSGLIRGTVEAAQGFAARSERARTCFRCGSSRFERVARIGITQESIMPFFGLFPWRCTICGKIIFRTLRHNSEDPLTNTDR